MHDTLSALLDQPGAVIAPGCHDALGARIAERIGFKAVYVSGNATGAATLGVPDIGLLGLSDMVTRVRGIASAVDLPVICDGDTGYGGPESVARTVREYEAAGAAAIHIEDQVSPKKCGAMPGLQVVPIEEALVRVRAAVQAKRNRDFLVIARTDARLAINFEEALRRGQAFAAAGADIVYVEGLRSREEIEEVPRRLTSVPLLFDVLEVWPWTNLPVSELDRLGYRIVIYCLAVTLAYAQAAKSLLTAIKEHGQTTQVLQDMMGLHEYEEILGMSSIDAANQQLGSDVHEMLSASP